MMQSVSLLVQVLTLVCLTMILFVVFIPYLAQAFKEFKGSMEELNLLDSVFNQINHAIKKKYSYVEVNITGMNTEEFRLVLKTLSANRIPNRDIKKNKEGDDILTLQLSSYTGGTISPVKLIKEEFSRPPFRSEYKNPIHPPKPQQPRDQPVFESKINNIFDLSSLRNLTWKKDDVKTYENNVIQIDFSQKKRKV